MHFIKRASWDTLKSSDTTPESVFNDRRNIIKALGLGAVGASIPGHVQAGIFDLFGESKSNTPFITSVLAFTVNKGFEVNEAKTPFDKVTRHNNFYEFGTSKSDPAENAQQMKVDPWTLVIDGEVDHPITLGLDDLTKMMMLEERTYRLRCVEAWSMVIPWVGFPLASLLKKAGLTSNAKYIAFETLFDPEQMPGQKSRLMGGGIHYPYVEGLTIAEAMNDLSFLAVGLYGKTLPPQNGAPIRLVVPWKYGFKSIKSLVRIRVLDKRPPTSWNQLAPQEYGFYANVNPNVDHPRWSQASERRIGEGGLFSAKRIKTQPFNGYEEQVAGLYQGIDLTRNF
ncbi:protein-methionine-sulfoxide reductase catalytic subunit MsrP [Shewanella sp. D64]|uniref:protein-methionine-sulfoxide reductase catalytic subunit MsrP n=1 Tax=unclassified Shewanella TaxID=196818 RepID=UPI0022BA660C|nr:MULTISPECIES: protein-methionine-sulfoxide reductase catalytic subunit MsrP [unclassified Shewanella]MEC4725314.1 protein-methionine-sulfoxide reductase catalytic subunit MsrP [Shewanella sp. D64]MEC4735840.1 protein-methionine-sulfoxide reductase catalytic subunit MsrP [Shewanella sp. E94]WBJ93189.1 protein-methionine-sulfoxide reductase catalytic subunit MsrP [Shewanella sp. MTB7]